MNLIKERKKTRKKGLNIPQNERKMRIETPRYIGDGILKTSLQKKEIDQEGAGTLATTLDDVQKITKDDSYGFDTRKFTDKFQQFEDIKKLKKTGQAFGRVGDSLGDLGKSKNLDQYQDKTAHRESLSQMTPEEIDVIANPEKYGATAKKSVSEKYSKIYSKQRGIDSAESNMFDADQISEQHAIDKKGLDKQEMVAFTDGDKKKDVIYYEADKINEGTSFIEALGRENKRQDQIEKGIVNHTPDGVSTKYDRASKSAGDHAKSALEREMKYKKVDRDNSDDRYIRTDADHQLIEGGTRLADGVGDAQPYQIKTGTVDPGDTMSSITEEVNEFYSTNYDEITMAEINQRSVVKNPVPGEKVQIGTVDEDGNVWKPPYEEGVVDEEYMEGLVGNQRQITHYHRNTFEDEDVPKTQDSLDQTEPDSWKGPSDAIAHNIGTKGNMEYRGTGDRSNQQIVYDSDKNLVTTDENKGSYDYVSPPSGASAIFKLDQVDSHLKVDVKPWIEFGNTPQDTTTREQRIEAMAGDKLVRQGLRRLGYSENSETERWELP